MLSVPRSSKLGKTRAALTVARVITWASGMHGPIADRDRSASDRPPSRRPWDSIQGFSSLVASISVLVCIPRKFDERGWKWRTK
jgi:hypothetical protein